MEKHLFKELDKNLLCIKEFFGNSADYFEKEILILGSVRFIMKKVLLFRFQVISRFIIVLAVARMEM